MGAGRQRPADTLHGRSHPASGDVFVIAMLLDSVPRDGTNKRTDAYGGSAENRVRLLLAVAEAVGAVNGIDRFGVRLWPSGE